MNTKHYEVIVLGENLSGLITATLLAARRYSVLWLKRVELPPQGYQLGPSYRRDPLLTPGILERPALAAVSRELNLGHKLRSIFKPASPLFQVADAHHRFDVSNERVALLSELQREFGAGLKADPLGAELDALDALNVQLDKLLVPAFPMHSVGLRQFFERRARIAEARKALLAEGLWPQEAADGPSSKDPLHALLKAVLPFTGAARDGFHPLFERRRASGVLRENLYRVGHDSLDELLFERYEAHGGKHLDSLALAQAEATRQGFRFSDGKNAFSSEFLVCAFDHFLLPTLFPQSRAAARYIADAARVLTPSHAVAKVSFLVSRHGIPEPMAHTLILCEDCERATNPLLIQRDPLLDDDAELERLDVFGWLSIDDLSAEPLRAFENNVIERMRAFLPFLSEVTHKIYLEQAPSAETLGTPWALAGRRLGYSVARHKGLFRGLAQATPLKGAFLAGPEVTPELGLEGDFMQGLNLARVIAHQKPHKDELKS